jgi:seryl-tRNA synthetase
MLDIKIIRNDIALVKNAFSARGADQSVLEKISRLDDAWRALKREDDDLRAERNKLGLMISDAKKKGGDSTVHLKRSGELSSRSKAIGEETARLDGEIKSLLLNLPNIPDSSVPIGKDENDNPEVRKWGAITKPSGISHDEIGERLGLLDFERGTKLGGHRFTVMYGALARLERAIACFMLNFHQKRGYLEAWVPHLVKTEMMQGTGQLPKFAEESYSTGDDLWLIPTAEVPLTNLHSGEILDAAALPKKYTALTPCYRREAGAYGKDIKGMIRQHQFDKVELVKICRQEDSFKELESLVSDAEGVLQALNLPYRTIHLCTGDMGFSSAKTYDIEVWIPSQGKYREISSCSNCTDFQARRANIRYRDAGGEVKFVHTLNGSGLAVGRTLIAILENYCDGEGVDIPAPLREMVGQDRLNFPKK